MRPIDADAFIAYCDEKWIPLNVDAVNAQPTIEPTIIRCEDCVYWQREWSTEKDCHYCTMIDDRTGREFYCANAERRTDG